MTRPAKVEKARLRNVIVVSDTHCGCRMGLCPERVMLDGGGEYRASAFQRKMMAQWDELRTDIIPRWTRGEPFILVFNGDAVDGVHHGSTTQISHNLTDQANIAHDVLKPLVEEAEVYYHIRGTEAHVGQSGAEEERLAQRLGAKRDSLGHYARWELWLDLAGHLCHFTHHIGASGSSAYEATAVGKEMVESFVESGRWGNRAPQVIVRSHRHRYGEWRVFGDRGLLISCVTPAWQGKTPYTYRIAGGRLSQPQTGGLIIRAGDEELHTRAMVWPMLRTKTEVA
jgi:hypothetical protein